MCCPSSRPRTNLDHSIPGYGACCTDAMVHQRKMENAPRTFVARGVITSEHFRLQRGVLQLLQRAHLEAYRSWLRRKPFVFTRERVLAEALLLGRNILRDDFQQAWQRELLRAFLMNRCQHRFFERRHQRLGRLRLHTRALSQVNGQRCLRERILDGFQGSGGRNRVLHRRCSGFLGGWRSSFLARRCCFLRSGSRSFLGSSCCHEFLASSQRLPKTFAFAPSPTHAKGQILGLGASVPIPT